MLIESDKITSNDIVAKLVENGLDSISVNEEEMIGKFIADDIINEVTGEVYAEAGDEISEELINQFPCYFLSIYP